MKNASTTPGYTQHLITTDTLTPNSTTLYGNGTTDLTQSTSTFPPTDPPTPRMLPSIRALLIVLAVVAIIAIVLGIVLWRYVLKRRRGKKNLDTVLDEVKPGRPAVEEKANTDLLSSTPEPEEEDYLVPNSHVEANGKPIIIEDLASPDEPIDDGYVGPHITNHESVYMNVPSSVPTSVYVNVDSNSGVGEEDEYYNFVAPPK